jgi:hypothetical protein
MFESKQLSGRHNDSNRSGPDGRVTGSEAALLLCTAAVPEGSRPELNQKDRGPTMPSGEEAQVERCEAAEERAPDSAAADATSTSGCACIRDQICGCLEPVGALKRGSQSNHRSRIGFSRGAGKWEWQCAHVQDKSERGKRFATPVDAMGDAGYPRLMPDVSELGRIERVDDGLGKRH